MIREYFQIFLLGGPVGLGYAIRLALVQRQLHNAMKWTDREKETHARVLRGLSARTNDLVSKQQGLNIAAAQFRAYCDKCAIKAQQVQP